MLDKKTTKIVKSFNWAAILKIDSEKYMKKSFEKKHCITWKSNHWHSYVKTGVLQISNLKILH